VIKSADHVIDLGPEGGDAGGQVVAAGAPEVVAGARGSHTGAFLGRILAGRAAVPAAAAGKAPSRPPRGRRRKTMRRSQATTG
jgi:excinuclease ABC subunit A